MYASISYMTKLFMCVPISSKSCIVKEPCIIARNSIKYNSVLQGAVCAKDAGNMSVPRGHNPKIIPQISLTKSNLICWSSSISSNPKLRNKQRPRPGQSNINPAPRTQEIDRARTHQLLSSIDLAFLASSIFASSMRSIILAQ